MTAPLARLLFPAIRWGENGYENARSLIEESLSVGVGGFILFGGEAAAARALITELQQRSAHALLIAADLERGAGQQFEGATALPPLAAFGHLDDDQLTERAGYITALEARAIGVNWVLAPVADVLFEPHNPIVGARSFGEHSDLVARHVSAWVRGCHQGRALACVKHFPGHGRTTTDSHSELPEVLIDASALERDIYPFDAAIKTDVDSIMTAHVRYLALDASGAAASRSHRVITTLLRERLQYRGLVVTDAINMKGATQNGGEAEAAVSAIAAGCDGLLYPTELRPVLSALEAAVGREISQTRAEDALVHVRRALADLPPRVAEEWGNETDHKWAVETGAHAIFAVRGVTHIANPIDIYVVDDDLGGPFPAPSRQHFIDALTAGGVRVNLVNEPTRHCMVAAFCDTRAWKQRFGFAPSSVEKINQAVAAGADSVVLFGHWRVAGQIQGANVLCAWGGEPVMQLAAAHRLLGLMR